MFVAGPVMLACILGATWYTNEVGVFDLGLGSYNDFNETFTNNIFFYMVIFSMLYAGRLFMVSVIAAHMVTVEENRGGKFDAQVIYAMLRKNIWKIIGAILLILTVSWIAVGLLTIAMHYASEHVTPVAFFLGFLIVVAGLIFYFPLSYIFSSVFFIMFKERLGGGASFRRAFKAVKGSFWNTWLIFLVGTGAMLLIWLLLLIPPEVGNMVYELFAAEQIAAYERNPWPLLIVALTARFTFNIFWGYYYLMVGFNYYTSVERLTGDGLKQRISEIGSGVSYRDVEPGY